MRNFLCIGIPARNEEESIERAIRNVMASDVWKVASPKEREIIVCVNHSSDNTAQIVAALSRTHPEISLFEIYQQGKNRAINTIVSHSSPKADVIYFSDADVLVKRNTIGKSVAAVWADAKIDFAFPTVLSSANFVPRNKRGFTASLFAEALKIGAEHKLIRLNGTGFAVRKSFLKAHPLPEDPRISDDRFINIAHAGRIKVLYDAVVVFKQPTLADHYRQRTRHIRDARAIKEQFPQLVEESRVQARKINPRRRGFFRKLSMRGKVGLVLNQLVEPVAQIAARRKVSEVWPKIKSTKMSRRTRYAEPR